MNRFLIKNSIQYLLWICLVLISSVHAQYDAAEKEELSQREDINQLQEKVAQLQNDIQALQGQNDTLKTDLLRLKKDLTEATHSHTNELARLETLIKKLDAAREQDRKTIVESVSHEIANLTKKTVEPSKTPSAPKKSSKPKQQEGVEHVVEKGQTLAAIAEAYGVSKKSIMDANKLTKPDLKIGQKLFIPKK